MTQEHSSRDRVARKISQAPRETEGRAEGPFSPADCTSDATSPNGTVIARNPIYQAFLRPSSMLCNASRRFSLRHSSRLFARAGPDREHRRLSSPCLELLRCRMVYVPPVPKTAIRDVGVTSSCRPPRQSLLFSLAFLYSLILSATIRKFRISRRAKLCARRSTDNNRG